MQIQAEMKIDDLDSTIIQQFERQDSSMVEKSFKNVEVFIVN